MFNLKEWIPTECEKGFFRDPFNTKDRLRLACRLSGGENAAEKDGQILTAYSLKPICYVYVRMYI